MSTVEISAELVKQLRERTQIGMMECKKALVEAQGDIEAAIEVLRKRGQLKAAKSGSRITAEGIIATKISDDQQNAAIAEVNCETDFVAKHPDFLAFAQCAIDTALNTGTTDVEQILSSKFNDSLTLEEYRKELITKIGENISLRRITILKSKGLLGYYNHGGRIGTIVSLTSGSAEIARDIAMHIAANNPLVLSPSDISNELVEKEREIFMAQADSSGKPAEIIAKMVEGKLTKFREENSLYGQAFVKDPNIKVSQYLKSNQAEIAGFVRYAVGEGIEKATTNFAEEVMTQVRNT